MIRIIVMMVMMVVVMMMMLSGADMHRTFPDNVYFQDDRTDSEAKCVTLFNVLTALAHNNRQVGYCQVIMLFQ